jgi:hypothetical protein
MEIGDIEEVSKPKSQMNRKEYLEQMKKEKRSSSCGKCIRQGLLKGFNEGPKKK